MPQLGTRELKGLQKAHNWYDKKDNDDLLVATGEALESAFCLVEDCDNFIYGIIDTVFPHEVDYSKLASSDVGGEEPDLVKLAKKVSKLRTPSPLHIEIFPHRNSNGIF